MLSIGLTGGIASGKSLVSSHLRQLGATVIDADQLAREVVEPGTPGLDEVVTTFGPQILDASGALNRPALAEIVFKDKSLLGALNQIIHPLVRARAKALEDAACPDTVVVQDIPLLVETGQSAAFNLVVVVQAATQLRLARMINARGMSREAALDRIAAQASDQERQEAADVVLENSAAPEDILLAVDQLWEERLLPFAHNLAAGVVAARKGPAIISDWKATWAIEAGLLAQRIMAAAGDLAVGVDHIGSTAVPGLAAKDVIDLQLRVASMEHADAISSALARAGFPRVESVSEDTVHQLAGSTHEGKWEKRLHGTCDPGRPVNLHVRVEGSPGTRFALAFRDWLRADAEARQDYDGLKRRLAEEFSSASSTVPYAEAKEAYFASIAEELRVHFD